MKKRLSIRYTKKECCPLCGGQGAKQGRLTLGKYRFGHLVIEYPEQGYVNILKCNSCGLYYKEHIPERKEMQKIFRELAPNVWNSKAPVYKNEASYLLNIVGHQNYYNVLDVGGGDGKFLKAMAYLPGRRSILDIKMYPEFCKMINGECITGFLEDDLIWSGKPYNIVCLLDMLEHMCDPKIALENIIKYLDGSCVYLHTNS